ncbi:MAG: 4Fe-4S ferredoxin iron-sulfur binding domain protein [Candidatus Shapirobacteria bacterium GW2011_GWE1_38_10]|uniref:Ferredoxin n=1 Tax=Candidatus Shapirobacteria bacterium GW2011_GWE1_38_10 TaxID=1618488 RepID=A0A0G0I7F6_9BACT|nr:MAG: 4Fe-4S ferredoxin iron-sulfur binding domain protein [Candidatus Shapirobacteria bacterium GW2011_GWF2_37_20]KKQ50477.1 MAG: 4Fe-4S ferredoxin iron-sulfur binding domain protein [Candidatus Shapirobacteria bacterium GW2011_GWE1_38_10]KKQ65134.1 MAG: 4Fe-4S ferredoxin iron-sulfur binding domain protein [Candidatus Shapirobacteria bacterium GW2011_GWF1_38_23]HBP50925.1 ferredoxin [Candidatus Shapirobacteria bacterium]
MSKFKVVVDQEKCIGCNTCPLIDPETFEMDATTYKAKVKAQPETITENVKTAISSCPVTAISIVEESN